MDQLPNHVKKILENRYFSKDNGETTWQDLCIRVARHVASAEREVLQESYEEAFFRDLYDRKFLPNTPTWINAGLDGKRSLSACFVLPLEDTMESILESSRLFGMVQKFGGGTGVALSKLRAKDKKISSTHGKACGPIAVLKYLAATSQMITQGGARQGANMAVLDVYHPDVEEFINVKSRESEYLLKAPIEFAQYKIDKGDWSKAHGEDYVEYCKNQGLFQLFNVSVAVDDKFMSAVLDFEREYKENSYLTYKNFMDPQFTDRSWREHLPCGLAIVELWNMIINMAWKSGDPGLLFIERANKYAKAHSPYPLYATNPCGEQYLPDYGSCNLGSIDLSKFVLASTSRSESGDNSWSSRIDWDGLRRCIQRSVRFLDNVVTINRHADPEITRVNNEERRLGLGIMGWTDFLLLLKVPYESKEAIEVAEKIAGFFAETAHDYSHYLAGEKGAFPLWEKVKDQSQVAPRVFLVKNKPRRNATLTTIAPTGTISLIAGCSSGIEPHFNIGYEHQGLKEHGGLGYVWASETLEKLFRDFDGDISEFEKYLRQEFGWKPANEISVDYHIAHQAVWQKYIDNSISKTLNLPNSASKDVVANAYILSYLEGCKGSTVYRDGCKPFQVLNNPKPKEEVKVEETKPEELQETEASYSEDVVDALNISCPPDTNGRIYLPDDVHAVRTKIATSQGNLYVHIGYDSETKLPVETFVNLGKSGSEASSYCEAIGKLISEMLRSRIHPVRVIMQLRGIKATPFGFGPQAVLSIPDAIGQALEKYMVQTFGQDWASQDNWKSKDYQYQQPETGSYTVSFDENNAAHDVYVCPECGSGMVVEEGCKKCYTCGHSECG